MFRPVGDRPASTYWRRRLILAVVVILVGVTIYLVAFNGGSGSTVGSNGSPVSSSSAAATHSPAQSSSPSATAATSASPAGVATVTACPQSALDLKAGAQAPSYPVAAQPVLYLQVTNTSSVPCSADLADGQIELLVYNGASRVWGSHDCQVLPGTSVQTLVPNTPVARSITWSGLSSEPGCSGVRQHVSAGSYTLHAKLAGVEGSTAAFSLT